MAAALERDEAEVPDSQLVASLLRLVDGTASRVVDHPVRPRVKVTRTGLLRRELDIVQVEVPAVLAAGLVLDRIVVRAEHVRISAGLPPHLHAAPVSVRAYVSQENVDRWVRTAHLPINLALTAEGALLTTRVRGFQVSETLADLEVSGRFLRLVPTRLKIAGRSAPLVRFFRGYLPLPPLPKGARLTEVRHADRELAVTFALERLDEPISLHLARRLRSLTRLPIPRLR
ncbi:MAG: LmeA family phospholipid-binding protein [Acidimicrobiales bacterium]